MAFMSSLSIAGSALTAERFRMDIISQNLANMNTTRTATGDPYRRKQVIFEERPIDFKTALMDENNKLRSGGVRISNVVESEREFTPVYDPSHPDANEEGYVMYPNVDRTEEQVDLMAASRVYEANLTALSVVKSMATKSLDIGK